MKEIFWGDYTIDEERATEMIRNGSEYEKRFLFGKILFNSSNLLRDIRYFNTEDLLHLLNTFEIRSSYKQTFALKRLNILKTLYLGRHHSVKGLEWKKRTT